MDIFRTLNNNLRHDIWGNYLMSRQLGMAAGYGYLAKKSWALARAVFQGKVVVFNGREFFDTWS